MSAVITTAKEATEFATAMAKEEYSHGREVWDVIVNVVVETAVRTGNPLDKTHVRYMRQYLAWNMLACLNGGVVTALAASPEFAKWAIMPVGTPLTQVMEDVLERSKELDSKFPEVIEYMRVIAKVPSLQQIEIVNGTKELVSDTDGLMKYVMENFG